MIDQASRLECIHIVKNHKDERNTATECSNECFAYLRYKQLFVPFLNAKSLNFVLNVIAINTFPHNLPFLTM